MQSKAKISKAEQIKAKESKIAKQGRSPIPLPGTPGNAKQSKAKQSKGKQSKAKQSNEEQSKAKLSKAKRSRAKELSKAKQI